MTELSKIFGSMVFNDAVMRERLPSEVYDALKDASRSGKRMDIETANVVAAAMKDWAIEKGATHFTHWFQPMTGVTAEKHDSFISNAGSGKIIMEFSGSELFKGESDASSFPSGGLRATFEARGYTAWDPTSCAFIKNNTLYIPTAFCSYGGEALDKKTPLLRSMEALNKQAMRVLRLFGNEGVTSVKTTAGPEQEYFLVSKELYNRRKDLVYTGRTLFGARPPKGQELDDHYFGTIKPKVQAFMAELDEELWKLGVLAKTEHNEAAPAQHELAPIFETTNIATDHNQLTMEIMQQVARKNGMVCLLHEKPFNGVNGSGKHNNWSIQTNTGMNLFNPGDTPYENAQFLLFLCAVIQAVDDYQALLRVSVSSAGNDHRLGMAEAPPAIVSMFLGDELSAILDAIEKGEEYSAGEKRLIKVGVHVLPRFPQDATDRNRTSPFAFTGNKFEFRMVGSSMSIASANIVINTAVAESLRQYADELEGAEDFNAALTALIRRCIREHRRIIFNGNGYDEAWVAEAEKRGLLNLPTTPDALPYYLEQKSIDLFARHKVLNETEMRARYEIMLENYCKVLNIEATTMLKMVRKDILPAAAAFSASLCREAAEKRSMMPEASCRYELETADRVAELTETIYAKAAELDRAAACTGDKKDITERSMYFRDVIIPVMEDIRAAADELETVTDREYWPFPTYGDLLYSND
ncbi:MAG: glutamine synthetase III [Oscillospiraceae bacterium]|nr:glutamine synthetase III [Oscillospiraceae bacterium]